MDNAVWLSALVMLALILAGLLVLGLSGLRLWRVVKATQKRIAAGAAALSAEADRLSAAMAALPQRQAEVQDAVAALAVRYLRIATLGVPFALVALAGQGWLRGVGNLRTPLVIIVAANGVNIVLEDDLDGTDADETVTFSLDGVGYEIDLSSANAATLRDAASMSDLRACLSTRPRSARTPGFVRTLRVYESMIGGSIGACVPQP